ncbi:hypothetical protein M622_18785 [Thauera terpenica 58Eu]|uniref:Uncharacterized protein n=1 Tax=Thauera terpenica 58Eu TaxID=1348657 RepID=S9ZAP2_9RHOO|nr:hypothetical protein [Thauera terpenica]EPZ14345.1 hypothetical protein M622_18785 [Thauera terpenica 58Eu]
MIKPEDFDYHYTAESHWQWAETIAIPFNLPDANSWTGEDAGRNLSARTLKSRA